MVIDESQAARKKTARNTPGLTGRIPMNHEEQRLKEALDKKIPWRKWGPYLSERQWGTVREDW